MEDYSLTLVSSRSRQRWRRLLIAFGVSIVIAIFAAGIGSVFIPPIATLQIILSKLPFIELFETTPTSWNTIIWDIRLPRVVTSGLVGGSLALAGATLNQQMMDRMRGGFRGGSAPTIIDASTVQNVSNNTLIRPPSPSGPGLHFERGDFVHKIA